ncbi:DUF397 domain-containing protein [Streptomyces hypolithicus]
MATCPDTVHVRDSKVKDGPTLALPSRAWTDFLAQRPLAPKN